MSDSKQHQVLARYFPRVNDGTDFQHKLVTGNTREELVANAQAQVPPGNNHYLSCLLATPEGPVVWVPNRWLPAADEYILC